ncbi:MAG TPA: AAA family ATPase [Gaiellaceae bacterium]|nr:AAA family ATPase [Gaiellaceae bacterium]
MAIIGRESELAVLRRFFGTLSDGTATIVLEGEPGVGKTTLWIAGVGEAESLGHRVLQARPGAAEEQLSFSALGDLLHGALDETLAVLPPPQRHALSRALLIEDAPNLPPDEHAVGLATLNAFRALADEAPLIIAVDDVQWLDAASSSALAYAARRLRAEQVGMLLARRTNVESPLVAELRSVLRERFQELDVGPVDSRTLLLVIRGELGVNPPRPILEEVHRASGGNPLYALEIVRTLRGGSSLAAGQPLPVPESLRDLVHGRVRALPSESRDFLLASALLSRPTVPVVESATGIARSSGLGPALDAQIVELEGDRIRFTHPLLTAGLYETTDPSRRRQVHGRLAELVEDPEARARHLAASVDVPTEAVADALEDAARYARGRGALPAAALLLERARELTPSSLPAEQERRTVDAARLHFGSGDSSRAQALLQDVLRGAVGSSRARALETLARIKSLEAQAASIELFQQAIDAAEGDSEILAAAHEGVATCLLQTRERLPDSLQHVRLAVELAFEVGDEGLAAEALGTRLLVETLLGLGTAAETAEQALALEEMAQARRVMAQPLVNVALHRWWTDQLGPAREALLEMLGRSRDVGDESSLAYVLVLLGLVETVLGELASAVARVHEGEEAAAQSGQEWLRMYSLAVLSLAEAHRGNEQRAREAAARVFETVSTTGGGLSKLYADAAMGHLELALGRPDAAEGALEPAVAVARREQIAEPAAIRFVVDYIEALIALGRPEHAADVLAWYEENAHRLERSSAIAASLRCRGMLAAQAGALDRALAAYEEALAWHTKVDIPLDRGRTLLALGAAQRRSKLRREARATLEEAMAVCEGVGAAIWAQRARDELRRISGRAPSRHLLTPAEEHVAALVAEGKTNREVATALFLSERTVEGHLSHVFGKLGVKRRGEVGPALAARLRQGIPESNTGDSPVSRSQPAP